MRLNRAALLPVTVLVVSSTAMALAAACGGGSPDAAPAPDPVSGPGASATNVVVTPPPPSTATDAGTDATPPKPNTPWPEWAFHHWVWEGESTQASALALLDDYAAHGIPVGAIMIDSPWETGYNTLVWDTSLFPNPQRMIDDIHKRGTRVLLWIVSAINTDVQPLYDQAKNQGFFMEQLPFAGPGLVSWWKGKGSLIDYFNPAVASWWQARLDVPLGYGIDGWKCDGIDISAATVPYSPGKKGFVSHADYAEKYYRDFFDYTRKKLGNDRIITARPVDTYGKDLGLLGSGAVAEATFAPRDLNYVGWVGDQDATFDGMKAALLNMYYSAGLGYLGFGSDIGGYRTDDAHPPQLRSKELFVRWAELGAFSPLMENGGNGEHRPWMFDVETTDIYRKFVKLHYALIPYFMEEGLKAFQQKKSLVTFVDKGDFRFLLGPDVFVAPMIASGTSRSVAFPAGDDWIYLFDKSKSHSGNTTATLVVPLGEFPVFLRKGSALAAQLVVP